MFFLGVALLCKHHSQRMTSGSFFEVLRFSVSHPEGLGLKVLGAGLLYSCQLQKRDNVRKPGVEQVFKDNGRGLELLDR